MAEIRELGLDASIVARVAPRHGRREFADAKRMGRELAEELRLLEDLGWSETIDRDTVTLTVTPLGAILGKLARPAGGEEVAR